MTLSDDMLTVGNQTAERVLSLLAAVSAGTATLELDAAVAATILSGIQRGQVLALHDYLAQYVAAAGELPAAPLPMSLPHHTDLNRLLDATQTVLDGEPADHAMRLDRLARSEVYEATQAQQHAIISDHAEQGLVEGWSRGVETGGCQLCVWWWRTGRIWPARHPMPTHKGCRCRQVPAFASHIQETVYTRRLGNSA